MRHFGETEKIEKESLGSYNLALKTLWWDKMETECLENIYADICNFKKPQRLWLLLYKKQFEGHFRNLFK